MASHEHARKKQFQPSISSYFHSQSTNSLPPLPAETQASLLNVGMRVRKSVREGYKTHKTVCPKIDSVANRMVLSQPARKRSSSHELTPFSGIHKIGALSQQELWSSSAPAPITKTSFDSTPSLTASQDTISSPTSFIRQEQVNRKRTYEEEMEESMDMWFNEMEKEDEMMARQIAQPKTYNRRQRMLDILDNAGDFPDAPFLQPDCDYDMNEEYT